jgi:hypothetical protein
MSESEAASASPPPGDAPRSEPELDDEEQPVEPVVSDRASVVVVGPNEDIATICGRIDTAPTYAVVVHAPGGNRDMSREIGIRRLKKHAEDGGRTVAIATPSLGLASRARQVRIPVARKPEHVRWDSGGRMTLRLGRVSVLVPPLGRYLQVLLFAGVALGAGWLLLAIGPSATVTAFPPTETVETQITITASPNYEDIDVARLRVPAQEVSSSRTVTLAIPTTGSQLVGVEPAVVTVTVYNDGDEDVELASGTVFTATGGAPDFELQEDVTIEAGGQLAVAAFAMEPGTAGNIEPGQITGIEGTRAPALRVENLGNGGGGSDGPAAAVDAADIVAIRALANQLAVVSAIKATIVEDRPHDAVFLDTATVEVTAGQPSDVPGALADILVMDVRVSVTAFAVVSDVLDEVARAVLSEGERGEFIPGSVSAMETGARQYDANSQTIETELLLRGEFARDVSSDDIESAVSGRSSASARAVLAERYGIEDAQIDVTPGWAPRLPRFGFRIDVELRARDGEQVDPGSAVETPTQAAGD